MAGTQLLYSRTVSLTKKLTVTLDLGGEAMIKAMQQKRTETDFMNSSRQRPEPPSTVPWRGREEVNGQA